MCPAEYCRIDVYWQYWQAFPICFYDIIYEDCICNDNLHSGVAMLIVRDSHGSAIDLQFSVGPWIICCPAKLMDDIFLQTKDHRSLVPITYSNIRLEIAHNDFYMSM